jgi:hypothetical protein
VRRSVLVVLVVAVSLLTGCTTLWDAANRPGLRSDVLALLEESGIHGATVEACHMVGSTRTGNCEFVLDEQQVDDLVAALAMEPLTYENWIAGAVSTEDGSCIGEPGQDLPTWTRFGDRGPFSVGDLTFFYVALQYNPADGRACLQVEYPYG